MTPVIANNNTNKNKNKNKNKKNQKQKRAFPATVEVEEVQRFMLHLRNNPDLEEYLMNNPTIRTKFAEYEVAYFKIQHKNPILAEVDIEFYHSLPPVQVLFVVMTGQASKAMNLEGNNIKPTSNTTICTSVTRSQPTIY